MFVMAHIYFRLCYCVFAYCVFLCSPISQKYENNKVDGVYYLKVPVRIKVLK